MAAFSGFSSFPPHLHTRGEDEQGQRCLDVLEASPPRPWRGSGTRASSPVPPASPPRPWRGRKHGPAGPGALGFTSTPVERTSRERRPPGGVALHLHARGEDSCSRTSIAAATASPPHAWREHESHGPCHRVGRFTSIRGEDRHRGRSERGSDASPPRVWRKRRKSNAKRSHGSPPRPWRGPVEEVAAEAALRFTSIYVEKTEKRAPHPVQTQLHLHTRGEGSKAAAATCDQASPPPRGEDVDDRRCSGLM